MTAQVEPFSIKGRHIDFSLRTYLMGILNVTPDSFSDGGKYFSVDAAVAHAVKMVEEGADIIDVGGESSRPKGLYGQGSQKISAEEELKRVIPVIERISHASDVIISIDTTKSLVAEKALEAGASIVNDISGLKFDEGIADVVAKCHASLVLMHMQGTPETMQFHPTYNDVVLEVKEELRDACDIAITAGVKQIIIDPGIGFGKNVEHNLTLIKHLKEFTSLGFPVLIGTSRKGFIGALLDVSVDERVEGTAASVAVAIMNGANIIRVHDVKEMKRVAIIVDAIRNVT
ncbi:MAG: dihydropteroate synthase [Bacteroidota bacterium]|nr:dihydropteroate synthase [Bacteroidota bacterium]